MTITKKCIFTLGIIAILSIFINSFVLSFLTSRNFNDYLDNSHEEICKDIVDFLVKDMNKKDFLILFLLIIIYLLIALLFSITK